MTIRQKESLRKLIDYNWNDELEDFLENGEDGDMHIFHHIVALDNLLTGEKATASKILERYHETGERP